MWISEYVTKKDGIILGHGVHQYDSVSAFKAELPVDAVETHRLPYSGIREWTRELSTDDAVFTERYTLRKEVR